MNLRLLADRQLSVLQSQVSINAVQALSLPIKITIDNYVSMWHNTRGQHYLDDLHRPTQ